MRNRSFVRTGFFYAWIVIAGLAFAAGCAPGKERADTILMNGKIITVDKDFSIAEAVAIRNGRFIAVGKNDEILAFAGDSTNTIDLKGRTVVPGLIEGHAHPLSASQSEYPDPIPHITNIKELMDWIAQQARTRKKGEWIVHPKFFITRLSDMRQLSKKELDSVAPDHPVFLNGSYAGMANSKAIAVSGLDKADHPGIDRSKPGGAPTGIVRRSAFGLLAIPKPAPLSDQEKTKMMMQMFGLYNSVGITSVCVGGGDGQQLEMYKKMNADGQLTVRVFQNIYFPKVPVQEMLDSLKLKEYKTGDGDDWVRVGALKVVVDGGVLTGTAYLNEGWGEKAQRLYGLPDPLYRGELFFSQKELETLISAAQQAGWKFTAHVTGGGGVDTLLAAFAATDRLAPVKQNRFSIIHGNFFSEEAVRKMAAMGIYADMQPDWFYKDGSALLQVLGKERLNAFHPYRSLWDAGVVVGGGSDHMAKLDPDLSINPYNPFLSIWSVVARKTENGISLYPEQALSRKEALQMYTINNAYASFEENGKGSIEPGKLADLAVLSDDLLLCPEDDIRKIKVLLTMVDGRVVYENNQL
ncbi:MAG TPA: amidohydrolase [Flavitalea sp.]|nr:amidohydrolase [Flavitalea sp.]